MHAAGRPARGCRRPVGRHRHRPGAGLRMVNGGQHAARRAHGRGDEQAVWKPAASATGSRYASPVIPARKGSTATASRPAVRATTLLTADATPACSDGAAPMAVEVSGATVMARPAPNTTMAGQHVDEVAAAGRRIRDSMASPTATTIGPDAHLQPGPDPRRQPTGPGREQQHDDGHRQQRQPRLERRVARRPPGARRAAGTARRRARRRREGHGVGRAELAGAEQAQAAASGVAITFSATRKATNPPTPTTKHPSTTGDVHPRVGPSIRA